MTKLLTLGLAVGLAIVLAVWLATDPARAENAPTSGIGVVDVGTAPAPAPEAPSAMWVLEPETMYPAATIECDRLYPEPSDAATCLASEKISFASILQMAITLSTKGHAEAVAAKRLIIERCGRDGIAPVAGSNPPAPMPSVMAACVSDALGIEVPAPTPATFAMIALGMAMHAATAK